jgi:hypothetical protein
MSSTLQLPEPVALLLHKAIEDSLASLSLGAVPFSPHLMMLDDGPDLHNRKLVHTRIAGEDLGEMLETAQAKVSPGLDVSAYAIAWDGRVTVGGKKTDAVLVELGTPSERDGYLFAQGYEIKKGWLGKSRAEKIGAMVLADTPPSRLVAHSTG